MTLHHLPLPVLIKAYSMNRYCDNCGPGATETEPRSMELHSQFLILSKPQMDWLCLQSLTYLCLSRGGYELEFNISTLVGDSIALDTDSILFYRDNIRWKGDIIAWKGGDWVLSPEIAAVLAVGFLPMFISYLGIRLCGVWSFSKERLRKESGAGSGVEIGGLLA